MGQLFYIIGASGVGKDSLISYVREKAIGKFPVFLAHRYITRPSDSGGENHISLGREEFKFRKSFGLFAMDWESHGNCYGIGKEIDLWLSHDCSVIVNGSREYLPEAIKRYPDMKTILIKANANAIHNRLHGRKRENEDEIEKRIDRSGQIDFDESDKIITIYNDGLLKDAGEALAAVILSNIYV